MEVSIWDTPGLERYHDFVETFCTGVHAAVILYDITQRDSLQNAGKWLQILRLKSTPNTFTALVGNKADLAFKRMVSYEVICVCSHMVYVRRKICIFIMKSNSVSR